MDWRYFKEHVSIIQLAETLGYSYNRRKGRSPRQYEHPNGDKVIISKKLNPNMEVYFTRNNYEDNGTVVDFVKHRLSMFNVRYDTEWEGVIKVLSEFSGKPYQPGETKNPQYPTEEEFDKKNFMIRPVNSKDLSYLQFDRQLSPETLQTFAPYMQAVRQKDWPFQNIGFPYIIPQKGNEPPDTVGYEVVNHMFKGHARGSNRREAVWIANLAPAIQLVRDVYFAESAIDAMSFYQLYKHKFSFDHSVFVSTGGNVMRKQVENVLNAFSNAKVHSIFDHDFSGKMYDIFLASIKANKEVVMRKHKDSVSFKLSKGSFDIPADQLSLAKFERVTGIRSGVRAHKSKGKDFNEMLQQRAKELSPKHVNQRRR